MGMIQSLKFRKFKKLALYGLCCIGLSVMAFQNCAPAYFISNSPGGELQPSSGSDPETPSTTLPNLVAKECDPSKNEVMVNDICVCDFNNDFFKNAITGQCEKKEQLPDLCLPKPSTCNAASLPQPIYDFNFNTGDLSADGVMLNGKREFSFSNWNANTNVNEPDGVASKFNFSNENICPGKTSKVLNFSRGVGLQQVDRSLLDSNNYTMLILYKFDYSDCHKKWGRIFNADSMMKDQGLYMYGYEEGRKLQFFNYQANGTSRTTTNQFFSVGLVQKKDSSKIFLQGYVNGQLQWLHEDTGVFSPIQMNPVFFDDDSAVPTEECKGAVARIMYFAQPLDQNQMACVDMLKD